MIYLLNNGTIILLLPRPPSSLQAAQAEVHRERRRSTDCNLGREEENRRRSLLQSVCGCGCCTGVLAVVVTKGLVAVLWHAVRLALRLAGIVRPHAMGERAGLEAAAPLARWP